MNQELINKYSIAVPRYTSYPPANFFDERFTAQSYIHSIEKSNHQQPEHISFYVHIPFCYKMCLYCGCNALLLENRRIADEYLTALKKEIGRVLPLLDKKRKIAQIHFGGGSPTSQPVSALKEIIDLLLNDFETISKPEIAIECHPGYMNPLYWDKLSNAGFNRVSIGIQDFNKEVLKAVNRKPSLLPIEDILEKLKEKEIAVNMDLLYGLPLQTPESLAETLYKATSLRPNRLVTFSYAHVPWVNPAQTELEAIGLPNVEEKNKLYQTIKHVMQTTGYETVGMDHFVLPDDELNIARKEKSLHRNFQGYCTRRTTGQVYAFGVTGISQLSTAYSQNVKELDQYIKQINEGEIPVSKGYSLNKEEQIAREVINALMCNYEVYWDKLSYPKEEVKSAINYNESVLQEFAQDNIIEFDESHIRVLPEAAPYVRNVAAALDKLLLKSDKKFSRVG